MATPSLNQQFYLDQLLGFARRRFKVSATAELDIDHLEQMFLQPFSQLHLDEHESVVNQPVRQVRLATEILRRFVGDDTDLDESNYLLATYLSMLQNLGISYEELRIARSDDSSPDDASSLRAALAVRLGIDSTNPQQLQELTLLPEEISEEVLESLFGIASTRRDPLAASPVPQPRLLQWQMAELRSFWKEQDDAVSHETIDVPIPIIDPDVVSDQDIQSTNPDDPTPALQIWRARRQFVDNKTAEIRQQREAVTTGTKDAYDHIITTFLGELDLAAAVDASTGQIEIPDDLDNLGVAELLHKQGVDLLPQLAARQLELPPFLHLLRIRRLATTETILEEEWEEVYAILVQVEKLRKFATWRDEERLIKLILTPDSFLVSGQAQFIRWRTTRLARRRWENTLSARTNQDRTTRHALQTAVGAVEEVTLPLLRDQLIATVASRESVDFDATANLLTGHLLVDFGASGNLQTTRLEQAIETVRGVLFSVRIRRFETIDHLPSLSAHPAADWTIRLTSTPEYTEADFDEEWIWMGVYANWRAVTFVLVYPQSFLLPSLREDCTDAFRQFVNGLRSVPNITPDQARKLANGNPESVDFSGYLTALRAELGEKLPEGFPDTSYRISESLSDEELIQRRDEVKTLFELEDLKHDHPELGQIDNPNLVSNWVKEVYYFVPMAIAQALQRSGQFLAALDWFQSVYAFNFRADRRKIYHGLVLEEALTSTIRFNPDDWLRGGLNPHDFTDGRKNVYTQFTMLSLVRCLLDFADQEFTNDSDESIPRARDLYLTTLDLIDQPDVQSNPTGWPSNAILNALRIRAELNLAKLRSGRNIAGMEKPAVPEPQEQSGFEDLPTIGSGGQLILRRPITLRPTPYRYTVLIARAKELVAIAQQMEATFLSTLEKRDDETYNLMRARHELQQSEATVDVQSLRISEAEERVRLTLLQQERSQIQIDTYQEWIDGGLNHWENTMIDSYYEAATARSLAAFANLTLEFVNIATTAASGGYEGAAALALVPVAGIAQQASFAATVVAINADAHAQASSVRANHERRKQEWELQKGLAEKDSEIGGRQIQLAQTQFDIVEKERDIARAQTDHAAAMVDFLGNKFTNAELYDWMSGILGQVYSYFLQQATAVAQLAENQLTFERQEAPPSFIQADYWVPPSSSAVASDDEAVDRRGLTGSARLLRDIYQLDQFAFQTNERKLQITQTISLADLYPFEFQRFRETGVLPFATPMEYFDRDFPGHYLRLIKRVRVAMIALVPPQRGIRATLTAGGLSRVVVGPDIFQTVEIRRSPELIAFTSPGNATGLFDLAQEGEMLLPFEAMGVDTSWQFELPKPANPMNYNSIADVLLTIEYTALHSFDYRQQVVSRIDRRFSGERPISIRSEFADQWYNLNNPLQPGEATAVQISIPRGTFPPNVDNLVIEQVLVYFSRREDPLSDEKSREITVQHLAHTGVDGEKVEGGSTTSIDGLVSTRRGNGSAWRQLLGRSPVGTWELSVPAEVSERLQAGEIDDILLIIVFGGETPPWPS